MEQRRRWPERQHLARLCDLVAVNLLSHLVSITWPGAWSLLTPRSPPSQPLTPLAAVLPNAGTGAAAAAVTGGRAGRPPRAFPGIPLASIPMIYCCAILSFPVLPMSFWGFLCQVNRAIRRWDEEEEEEQGCESDQVFLPIPFAYAPLLTVNFCSSSWIAGLPSCSGDWFQGSLGQDSH